MGDLAPVAVAIPLVTAAMLVAVTSIVPRRVIDMLAIASAIACLVLCALVLDDASDGTLVHWFGGWTPREGIALGISFSIDQIGAGLALFASALFLAAFVFCWRYFIVIGPLFHALMLVFLAAMLGFSYTGDLFNLFVFFELMSVAAYALVAYDIEEEGPLLGALNFAITNSIGAFLILVGIALLYGRTGALNMAQIGDALAGQPADGLVVVAFTLMAVGFFVKAAVVPFHFWLADAYSVAPTPVCLLLSAAMSELGLYAFARVYWTVFSGTLGGEEALEAILIGAGALTALVGAVMAFGQRHLKRTAGLRHGQPRGPLPNRDRPARRRRAGRDGALRGGRRACQGGAVRGRGHVAAPVRKRRRTAPVRPGARAPHHRSADGRVRACGGLAAPVRALARQGPHRRRGARGRGGLGRRARVRDRIDPHGRGDSAGHGPGLRRGRPS